MKKTFRKKDFKESRQEKTITLLVEETFNSEYAQTNVTPPVTFFNRVSSLGYLHQPKFLRYFDDDEEAEWEFQKTSGERFLLVKV
ncbi:MAG TPA: hypothetical protein VGI82_05055 [Chitinophagaceae bacterium]|jgi:hypothetical protein